MKKIALTLSFFGLSFLTFAQTADEIINKYVTAIGGKEAIAAIKDYSVTMTGEVQGSNLEVFIQKKAPNKSKSVVTVAGMGEVQNIVFDGTKARSAGMQGTQDISNGAALDAIKMQSIVFPEAQYASLGVKTTLAGTEKVNGKDAYKIDASLGESKWTEFYDVNSGLKIRQVNASEMGTITADFDDYKEVNGIKVFHKMNQDTGMFQISMTLGKVEINKGIEDSVFEIK
jgi:zinc protease